MKWLLGVCAGLLLATSVSAGTLPIDDDDTTDTAIEYDGAGDHVVITEDDVLEQRSENARRAMQRAIRRDFERTQNWADDDGDAEGY